MPLKAEAILNADLFDEILFIVDIYKLNVINWIGLQRCCVMKFFSFLSCYRISFHSHSIITNLAVQSWKLIKKQNHRVCLYNNNNNKTGSQDKILHGDNFKSGDGLTDLRSWCRRRYSSWPWFPRPESFQSWLRQDPVRKHLKRPQRSLIPYLIKTRGQFHQRSTSSS